MKQKKIALVDGNNFFASCEQMVNPILKEKAVCVLSNNDGCVIARSKEAKLMGIAMGMPYFMAKKSFPDAVYLSANFSLYHEISSRMMQLLGNYSDKIDIYSIDEAFLDLTGSDKVFKTTYNKLIYNIKQDIEDKIGISVSVGLSSSKILAKLANHKAKKANGVYFIEENLIFNEIENIPVEEIWGIGRNLARTFRKYGIFYAHELLQYDDEFFKRILGKKGLELKYELNGQSVIPLTGEEEKPKSIQKTRAFPEFSKDKEYIKTEIMMHLHNVCKKLRLYNLDTSVIAVMLQTKDFRTFYKDIKLDISSNSEIFLANKVIMLFESIYKEDIVYRSSGVLAFSLCESFKMQLSLFNKNEDNKDRKISGVIDKLEDKFGKGTLAVGSAGIKDVVKKHTREKRVSPF